MRWLWLFFLLMVLTAAGVAAWFLKDLYSLGLMAVGVVFWFLILHEELRRD